MYITRKQKVFDKLYNPKAMSGRISCNSKLSTQVLKLENFIKLHYTILQKIARGSAGIIKNKFETKFIMINVTYSSVISKPEEEIKKFSHFCEKKRRVLNVIGL